MTRRRRTPKKYKGQPCAYCQRPMRALGDQSLLGATRDHVTPKSRGGSYTVISCRACNNLKADKAPHEWVWFMAKNPGWWKLAKESKRTRYAYKPPA